MREKFIFFYFLFWVTHTDSFFFTLFLLDGRPYFWDTACLPCCCCCCWSGLGVFRTSHINNVIDAQKCTHAIIYTFITGFDRVLCMGMLQGRTHSPSTGNCRRLRIPKYLRIFMGMQKSFARLPTMLSEIEIAAVIHVEEMYGPSLCHATLTGYILCLSTEYSIHRIII